MEHGKALAAFSATVNWRDLPGALREKVVDHVVDAIGVMYSGIGMEACANARRAAALWGAGDDAAVIGTKSWLPAPSARREKPNRASSHRSGVDANRRLSRPRGRRLPRSPPVRA